MAQVFGLPSMALGSTNAVRNADSSAGPAMVVAPQKVGAAACGIELRASGNCVRDQRLPGARHGSREIRHSELRYCGRCLLSDGHGRSGFERTLVRDLVQSDNRSTIFSTSLVLRGILTLLVVCGLAVWLVWHRNNFSTEKTATIVLCTAWSFLIAISPKSWFDARYEMGLQGALQLVEKLVYGVLLVFLFVIVKLNPTPWIAAPMYVHRWFGELHSCNGDTQVSHFGSASNGVRG